LTDDIQSGHCLNKSDMLQTEPACSMPSTRKTDTDITPFCYMWNIIGDIKEM